MVALNTIPTPAAAPATPAPVVIATNVDFATAIENDLGVLAPTTNEIDNILRWMTAENNPAHWTGTAGHDNPLNNGYGSGGGAGLGSYPNLATAAQDVAANLTSKAGVGYGYGAIATDLRTNASPLQFATDVEKSAWAASRYGVAAAGAPAKYVVGGRGFDYIANLPVPGVIGGGDSSSAAPGASASTPTGASTTAATLTGFPGGALDPLNIPGEIGGLFGGVAKAGGGAIASALLGVIDAITKPLKAFVEDSALVVIGIIVVVVGLVVIAHAVTSDKGGASSSTAPAPAGRRGQGGAGAGAGAGDEAAEAAAL